jgi:hypothetical protein
VERLVEAYRAGELKFFGEHQLLANAKAFDNWIKPLRKVEWVVYAKRPFAGPKAVLAYCRATPTGSPSLTAAC